MNYAVITIDTEAWHGDSPIDRLIWGKNSDGEHGLAYLIDLIEKHGVKAIFFLDFAECWDYGEDKIQEVADYIIKRGHTIGVHIHPAHMADSDKDFLWQYSLSEQENIISRVTAQYRDIVGCDPKYFRVGKYAANNQTLNIIADHGYKYDFSEFYGNKWCQIDPPITADHSFNYGPFWEFPVTVFCALKIFGFQKFDKIDMEMSTPIYRYVLKKFAKQNDKQVVSLFGHSFSFVGNRYSENMNELYFDESIAAKFENCLSAVEAIPNLSLISPEELEKVVNDGDFNGNMPNSFPSVKIKNPLVCVYYFYATAWRIKSFNKNAQLLLTGTAILVIAALYLFISSILWW